MHEKKFPTKLARKIFVLMGFNVNPEIVGGQKRFLANGAFLIALLSHVFSFKMCIEMEPFVEFQATNIAEILLWILPNVDSNVLLQVGLKERTVRTKITKHFLNVHV